jgi:hypothetical protein
MTIFLQKPLALCSLPGSLKGTLCVREKFSGLSPITNIFCFFLQIFIMYTQRRMQRTTTFYRVRGKHCHNTGTPTPWPAQILKSQCPSLFTISSPCSADF